MKAILIAVCLLAATAAYGQVSGVLSSEPQLIQPVSHPQRAVHQSMSAEQNLLIPSNYLFARGEQPLWEFGSIRESVPLGDVARNFWEEHQKARKATKTWQN
jgi:hypothetical protein